MRSETGTVAVKPLYVKPLYVKPPYVKPLDVRWVLGVPLLCMIFLWLFPPDHLDLWLADAVSVPGVGFPLKKNPFLEIFLHDAVKQMVIVVGVGHLLVWIASYFKAMPVDRRACLYVFVAMMLSTGIVSPLKNATQVHCPWSIDRYGGVEHYSSVFEKRAAPVEKTGKCWPAGHAATGFCLFAVFFAWRDRRPRMAKAGLIGAIVVGSVLASGRMLQGAHFFSHGLWTFLIEWSVCALLYYPMLYYPLMKNEQMLKNEQTLTIESVQRLKHNGGPGNLSDAGNMYAG